MTHWVKTPAMRPEFCFKIHMLGGGNHVTLQDVFWSLHTHKVELSRQRKVKNKNIEKDLVKCFDND